MYSSLIRFDWRIYIYTYAHTRNTRILIQLFRLPMLHLKLTTICQRGMVGLRSNGFGVQPTAGQN